MRRGSYGEDDGKENWRRAITGRQDPWGRTAAAPKRASAPAPLKAPRKGVDIGHTRSGGQVFAGLAATADEYRVFTASDHQDAARLHMEAARKAGSRQLANDHYNRASDHGAASERLYRPAQHRSRQG